jgi:hypothetical protein
MEEEERETHSKNTDKGYTRKLFSNLFEREKPEDKTLEMCGLMVYQDCLTSKQAFTIQYT